LAATRQFREIPGVRLRAILIAMLLAAAGPALAQSAHEAAAQAALNQLIPPPAAQAIVPLALADLQNAARLRGTCVPTGVTLGPIAFASATRLAVDGIGTHQMRNVWSALGTPLGCANALPARFVIVLKADDTLLVRAFANGESIAWVSLVIDARSNIAGTAMAVTQTRHPDWTCTDTSHASFDKVAMAGTAKDLGPDFYGVRYTGSWDEVWTYTLCNHSVDVPITFTADGNGGAYWNAHIGPAGPGK
jgi:hypothetical protein